MRHLLFVPAPAGRSAVASHPSPRRAGGGWRAWAGAALVAAAAAVFPFGTAAAQPGVSVAMIGSPNLTLKHNDPCAVGSPRAMYASFLVTNTSGAPLSNLSATISGFANGISLAGGQPARQFIGALPAGGVKTLYWYVQYPCTFGVSATLTVGVSSGTGPATTGSGTLTTRAMQATGTGGQLQSALLGQGAVVGQTISLDVEYTFGNTQVGDEFDHQPAGNTSFNAGCFQLTGTQIVSSQANGVPAGTVNRTYFVSAVSQGGSGHAVVVRFFFKYLCAGVTSANRPYANQTSGSTNLKYSSNFDTFVGPTLPIATNPFSLRKTVTPKQMPSTGTVTYTVVVTNPSAFTAEADSIVDLLPAGVSFGGIAAGSQVTAANSGSLPAAGATGRIVFRGDPGRSFVVPAGGTLTLVYTAFVGVAPGRFVNSAQGFAGVTSIGTGADTVVVGTANLALAKAGPDSVVVGDTLTYVLVTSNAGPHPAFDVVVRDSLPAGVAFVSASRSATFAGGVVTWPAIASLAAGASRTDTVRVAAPASLGSLLNVARASSSTFDPTPGDNDGSAPGSRVTTQVVGPIVVTPDGLPAPLSHLPGRYAQVFTVNHRAGVPATFDLLAAARGAAGLLSVDSIRGTGAAAPVADSLRLPLPARTVREYTVWYTVLPGDTASGATWLLARGVSAPVYADSGWAQLRRAFPRLTLAKQVSPTGVIAPGTTLTYEIAFANAGEYAAAAVQVHDEVPAEVLFRVGSASQALPGGVTATLAYSSDGATWAYVPVSGGCGAPTGHDGCVRRIRWTLSEPLAAGAAASSGTVRFEALIR